MPLANTTLFRKCLSSFNGFYSNCSTTVSSDDVLVKIFCVFKALANNTLLGICLSFLVCCYSNQNVIIYRDDRLFVIFHTVKTFVNVASLIRYTTYFYQSTRSSRFHSNARLFRHIFHCFNTVHRLALFIQSI